MVTMVLSASALQKGDVLIKGDNTEHEVTRLKIRATSVSVLLDGWNPLTLRPTELLYVKREA